MVPECAIRCARPTEQRHGNGEDGRCSCTRAANEAVDNFAGHLASWFFRAISEWSERFGRVSQIRGPGVLH